MVCDVQYESRLLHLSVSLLQPEHVYTLEMRLLLLYNKGMHSLAADTSIIYLKPENNSSSKMLLLCIQMSRIEK